MKTITLVKIAAVGGVLTCTMGLALQNKINNNIKQTEFFKTSMKLVRRNKAAVHLLGEPIKDAFIQTLNRNNNYISDTTGMYEIKLKGSKQNGKLYIYIEKDPSVIGGNPNDAWKLKSLELDFDKEPERRLIINTQDESESFST